jgi:hypothetical protein
VRFVAHLRLLAVCFLSQARLLGGLHRASQVPFRSSYFTLHSLMQRYAPRAHRLPVQAMGFSTHYIMAPRGALCWPAHLRIAPRPAKQKPRHTAWALGYLLFSKLWPPIF